MAAVLLDSIRVEGPAPDRTPVRILFYEDGSVRFRISTSKLFVLEEAFLGSRRGQHVILKLTPRGS